MKPILVREFHGRMGPYYRGLLNHIAKQTTSTDAGAAFDEWTFEGTLDEFVAKWGRHVLYYPVRLQWDGARAYAGTVFVTEYSNFHPR
jgi:hypothetical protein